MNVCFFLQALTWTVNNKEKGKGKGVIIYAAPSVFNLKIIK